MVEEKEENETEDIKKYKKLLRNRQSAKRSRTKKKIYVKSLESQIQQVKKGNSNIEKFKLE